MVPEPEHQPVIEEPGVVEAVGIADQRIRGPAQIQQPVPIGIVAGESRHLQGEHDPHLAPRDLRGQFGEPLAGDSGPLRRCPRSWSSARVRPGGQPSCVAKACS